MLEKRGYIDPDWTPDNSDEKQATSDKIEQLDNDLNKRLAEDVASKVKCSKCECDKKCEK